MPLSSNVEFSDSSPAVRDIYSDYLNTTNSTEVPIWLKSLAQSEKAAAGYWAMVKNVLIDGELPILLKEMVIFLISVTNGSHYCVAAHAHSILALDRGMSYPDLMALTGDLDHVEITPAIRVALKFAVKVSITPERISTDDFASLKANGYSASQRAELISTVALATIFNMYAKTMKLPIDEEYQTFRADGADKADGVVKVA